MFFDCVGVNLVQNFNATLFLNLVGYQLKGRDFPVNLQLLERGEVINDILEAIFGNHVDDRGEGGLI